METIFDIADSIKKRVVDEHLKSLSNRAIARVRCNWKEGEKTFFLTNKMNANVYYGRDFNGNITSVNSKDTTSEMGQAVYKNTRLGQALIGKLGVEAQYKAANHMRKVTPLDRAVYSPYGENATEIQISLANDENSYEFASLKELLSYRDQEIAKLDANRKALEQIQRDREKLQKQQEEAQKRAKEAEQKLLEAERLEKEREAEERNREIQKAEENIEKAKQLIKQRQALLHQNVALRSQHILDPFQENAKRSHVYDGVPIVIEGGPGTGKTTTVIQRLKFLLSKQSLEDYDAPLTPEQLKRFEDSNRWSQQWLFFSPTDLLLRYLQGNMHEEELNANEKNTRTIESFRKVMLREYGIIDPSNPKFKQLKINQEEQLILNAESSIELFKNFCIEQVKRARDKVLSIDCTDYVWCIEAEKIQNICKQVEIKDLVSLMHLLETLYNRRDEYVNPVDGELRNNLSEFAMAVKTAVTKDPTVTDSLKALFAQWKKDEKLSKLSMEISDDADEDILDDSEEISEAETVDFDTELYTNIRSLIRSLASKKVDSKTKITRRKQELLEKIESFVDRYVNQDDLKNLGEYVLFSKVFSSFCRGTESLFINKIPQMYKLFRKDLLTKTAIPYNKRLLEEIVKKDNNRSLHADEQNLLIGYINNTLILFSEKFNSRFMELKGKHAKAYKENCRPIIGVDEATDYTVMDYYCMISFRYYEFSSITLSGDLMQGLRANGIQDWEELKGIFPNLEIFSLNISYRQTPTLVDMARNLYKDSIGELPSYNSKRVKLEDEKKPILFVSDDMTEKVEWICRRILDIYNNYDLLPSVAIFVGDDVNVSELLETVEDVDVLTGIEVVDCTGGKDLKSKDVVRVFRLSEIKGMEFEAAFFYDIDTAIYGKSRDLMRRNLYVGVSRAASHLAATMTTAEGNESIIQYFETDNPEW